MGTYRAIVMGASAGGLDAWARLFAGLPKDYPVPIIAIQHLHQTSDGYLVNILQSKCTIIVEEAMDKGEIRPGTIYFAPSNYHLLVEPAGSFALSVDPRVNYSRPSIDVLFESAARVWGESLIGILLTGASSDGTKGINEIKEKGGLTIVQDPIEAEYTVMPQAAVDAVRVDKILKLEEISVFLRQLNGH